MTSLNTYIEDFIRYKEGLGYSCKTYKCFLNDYLHYAELNEAFELKKETINQWCQRRSSETENGLRRRVIALREFTKYLNALKIIDFIIPSDFLPHQVRYTPYIFSDDELLKLFDQADRAKHNKYCPEQHLIIPVIYRLIYFCGLRPNEGRELLTKDEDLNNGTLFIRKNKTHKERIIPMSDDVTAMCRTYYHSIDSIFPNSKFFFPSSLTQPHTAEWLTG